MATAQKLTENHLSCAICTEVFSDPATLQCNHTFCKSCLLKYTKTQLEAVQGKSIRCPSCRQQTKVANPDSPVEEWVSQLKPSHVIQGLLDDFGPGTKAVEEHVCSECTKQGKTTPATSRCSICDVVYCDGCLKRHNMVPGLCDHEVAHLSDHTKTKVKRRLMCQVHRDKPIELFCKDCKKVICTLCCSIKHRTCKDVDTIESMTSLMTEQLTNKLEQLRIKMTTTNNIITRRTSKIQDVKSNSQTLKDQVTKTRETVMRAILRKEKQLLWQIDKSTDEQLHELQADIKSQEIDLQMYQQQYDVTANAMTSNCEMDMYDVYESMGETSPDNNRDTGYRPAAGRVVFTHDLDKLSKAVDELQLGKVEVVHDVSDPESFPILHHTIDCKEGGDRKEPDLFDVTVLTVGDIKVTVVADYDNTSLKTYYTSNLQSFHKQLLLSNGPWQIAKLNEGQIFVSVPDSKEIVKVKVTPDPVLVSIIKTSKVYCALACLNPSQLVVSIYEQPHLVDILDMTGKILRSINKGVGNPDYIHVSSSNNLLVSERAVESLVCVTSEGGAVFTYTPTGVRALSHPWGITTSSSGDILLVDYDSHKVIQLTESGHFYRDVVTQRDGLEYPRCVCLDGDGLMHVISDRYIKVFKFWRHRMKVWQL